VSREPDWNQLYETAASQEGLFTTGQAAEAGYSPQLLIHHCHGGRMTRVQRGIYRLVHFPAGEHEDLVAAWLWSAREGVLSHATALALHGLSDVLPSRIHLTLPSEWKARRFRIPTSVRLHHADVPRAERQWSGAVPVTTVARTLNDCAKDGMSPELLGQAVQQALRRGLVRKAELRDVVRALKPFGGLTA
jgi:predicted transcriptional regulator of viral defense system